MLRKLIKFAITGGLGTITNLLLFFIFADIFKFNPKIVTIGCFLFCCTQNYIINHLWTFKIENKGESISIKKWFKFFCGSLVGFAINFTILSILIHFFDWNIDIAGKTRSIQVVPQGIGILCGMIFNFLFSNFIVFKKKEKSKNE